MGTDALELGVERGYKGGGTDTDMGCGMARTKIKIRFLSPVIFSGFCSISPEIAGRAIRNRILNS